LSFKLNVPVTKFVFAFQHFATPMLPYYNSQTLNNKAHIASLAHPAPVSTSSYIRDVTAEDILDNIERRTFDSTPSFAPAHTTPSFAYSSTPFDYDGSLDAYMDSTDQYGDWSRNIVNGDGTGMKVQDSITPSQGVMSIASLIDQTSPDGTVHTHPATNINTEPCSMIHIPSNLTHNEAANNTTHPDCRAASSWSLQNPLRPTIPFRERTNTQAVSAAVKSQRAIAAAQRQTQRQKLDQEVAKIQDDLHAAIDDAATRLSTLSISSYIRLTLSPLGRLQA
jgi:hypothetical protein